MGRKKQFAWQDQKTVDEEVAITEVATFLYPDYFREGATHESSPEKGSEAL